jgi:hypothetical protein
VSELVEPPALKITVFVPRTPIDAPPRVRPKLYLGGLSGDVRIGDLARTDDVGFRPTAFDQLLYHEEKDVRVRRLQIKVGRHAPVAVLAHADLLRPTHSSQSLEADSVIILASATDTVRLGNLTVAREAWVTLDDSAATVEGRFQARPGASLNIVNQGRVLPTIAARLPAENWSSLLPHRGRIDVSAAVHEPALLGSAAFQPSPPTSLEPLTLNAETMSGNINLKVDASDARVPLNVRAISTHGVVKGTPAALSTMSFRRLT